ncbi:MAG TPA: MFS transporter [Phycisphaerae bacterium]|nr:MFS transporter [Phycisphaerae bacterium]HRY71514.1 MFS transporter [Phycisphaerae bacterium]HSA30130.1 MFS transporter [Phycisphaerae bacterium]
MDLLQPTTIAGLLATGSGVALLGSVKVALARKLQIDETRVGGLVSMFGFAMIPVMLSVGFLTDLVGKQPVLIGGSVVLAASLVLLARAKHYGLALLGVLMLSAGWATVINVVNPLSLIAFGGTKAYALNLACFYFGLGAFVTPLVVAFLLRRVGLAPALLILAGFVLVTALLAVGADFSAITPPIPPPETTGVVAPGMITLLSDAMMWLCALGLVFYSPLEASMAAWATTHLGQQGVSEGAASGVLSTFWLTFMASRLMTAFALPAGGEAVLILGLSLVCIAVLAGVVWGRGRTVAATMVIAAGLVFGPIFPTIMAVLLGHFEPSVHGRAVGLFFAIGGIGWTTIPLLMGAYAQRTSVQRGFLIAVASAAGLCATAAALLSRVSGA